MEGLDETYEKEIKHHRSFSMPRRAARERRVSTSIQRRKTRQWDKYTKGIDSFHVNAELLRESAVNENRSDVNEVEEDVVLFNRTITGHEKEESTIYEAVKNVYNQLDKVRRM